MIWDQYSIYVYLVYAIGFALNLRVVLIGIATVSKGAGWANQLFYSVVFATLWPIIFVMAPTGMAICFRSKKTIAESAKIYAASESRR